jgi:mannose-6-phosphate isomerase-like protein (cupin superfamily)
MLVSAMPHPCIIPWNEANARRHDKGFMLPFVNESCGANQLRLHVSVINPGEAAHPPHQHAGEEIIFVFEGEGEATIGEEKHPLRAMGALFCPEHVMHGLRNTGKTPIKYAVIRVPEIPGS